MNQSYHIDDYLVLPVTTHQFSTGDAYQPTTLTYSIYEENSEVGIDDAVDLVPASPHASKTGLYLIRRQLTAAAGFEVNKTYVVLVEAVIDGVSAKAAYTFQVEEKLLGSGAISWTYTVLDEDTQLPIADVSVWVTTDLAGSNVIASGTTNQSGQVTFQLDAGTVYVWSKKSGVNFTNPDTEVVA